MSKSNFPIITKLLNPTLPLKNETPSSKSVCIIIFLLPLIFYSQIWILGEIPGIGDVPLQFEPWKIYTAESLKEGRIPLWNPYTACGAPFMANLQSAVFYPVDFLLTLISPAAVFGIGLIVHAWIAGFGMFLFTRLWRIPPWGCGIAAIAWMFNGFIMIHIFAGNQLTVTTTAWIPFVFWGVSGYIKSCYENTPGKGAWIFISALIMSLEFLSGHPQITFYTGCFLLIWVIGLTIELKQPNIKWYLQIFGGVIAMGILAAGLSAVQLIPTLEYMAYSGRHGRLDFMPATEFTFAPSRLITLIFPEFYGTHAHGNYWGKWYEWSQAYIGEVSIILIFILLFNFFKNLFTKHKKAKPNESDIQSNNHEIKLPIITIPVATAIAFLFSCGRQSLIYKFLFHTTPLGNFRAPAKFLPFFMMFLLLLASTGALLPGKKNLLKTKLGIWGFVTLVGLIVFLSCKSVISEIGYGFIFIGLSGFLISMRKYNWAKYGMLLMIFIDLLCFGTKYLKFEKAGESPIYQVPPEISWLHNQSDKPFRVATGPDIGFPNWFIPWHIENASAYDPMSIGEYMSWVNRINGKPLDEFIDSMSIPDSDSIFLDLCNIKYYISLKSSPREIGPLVFKGPIFNIYLNEHYMPRVMSVESVEVGDITAMPVENFRKIVYIDPSEKNLTREYSSKTKITEVEYINPENLKVSYNSPDPGYLVWSSIWYPGWIAEMPDGREISFEKVNSCFCGIEIPKGNNTIFFRYLPKSYSIGKRITIIIILVYFMFFMLTYLFKRQWIKS